MPRTLEIVGYVVVSAEGHLADAAGLMPNSLKFEPDQRFFVASLNHADVVVNGKLSHEGQVNSPKRKRLTVTRSVASLGPDPDNPMGLRWNPAGLSFEKACAELGVTSGTAAIIGGPQVFSMFLPIGYHTFQLCCAPGVSLPGGMPALLEARDGKSVEDVLHDHGLAPGSRVWFDEAADVYLRSWTPRAR